MPARDIVARFPWPVFREWTVGEPRTTPNGKPLEGRWKDTYACFDIAPVESGEPCATIEANLTALEAEREFLQSFVTTGGTLSYYLAFFSNDGSVGESFPVGVLQRLVALGIELGVETF